MPVKDTDSKNNKKKRRKKLLCWLVIDLSVAFIVFALLLYKPGKYNPIAVFSETDEVHPYITKLTSEVYNNIQFREPFDILISQEELNIIMNNADWPIESEGILLYKPAALINDGEIVLMGTADFQGIEFIITIGLKPEINEEGLLNIEVATVKVGAVNITPLAKITAKKMYAEKLPMLEDIDPDAWQTKLIASLLNEEAFTPSLQFENKTVILKSLKITEGLLKATIIAK